MSWVRVCRGTSTKSHKTDCKFKCKHQLLNKKKVIFLTQVPPTASVCSKTVGRNFETSLARWRQAQRPAAPAPITTKVSCDVITAENTPNKLSWNGLKFFGIRAVSCYSLWARACEEIWLEPFGPLKFIELYSSLVYPKLFQAGRKAHGFGLILGLGSMGHWSFLQARAFKPVLVPDLATMYIKFQHGDI